MMRYSLAFIILFSCRFGELKEHELSDGGILLETSISESSFSNQMAYKKYVDAMEQFKEQDFVQAKEKLSAALTLDPDNDIIIGAIGLCELALGNFETAISLENKAIRIRGGEVSGYQVNLSKIYLRKKEYKHAIRYSQKVIDNSSSALLIQAAYLNKAIALYELNELDSALTNIDKSILYSNVQSRKSIKFARAFKSKIEQELNARELRKTVN